ncbi:MAG TPA: TIGR04283 family arsenosugar biosynthesis glycosyltransferase [Thermoanaerobaculia bacterium]
MSTPRLSVVIPALDERDHLPRLLRCLLAAEDAVEIVVADGGSTDGTWELRHDFPSVTFIRAPRGRALQLNAGAAAARGRHLLFLHADTLPPLNVPGLVEAAIDRDGAIAGAFRLAFDDGHPLLRLYAWCSRCNHALFTYGDQGLFLRRDTFDALGGFAPIPLMEDVDLVRRLRRLGRFAKLPATVVTSARRFRARGIVRQQLLNLGLVAAYYAGIAPQRLAGWYRVAREPQAG